MDLKQSEKLMPVSEVPVAEKSSLDDDAVRLNEQLIAAFKVDPIGALTRMAMTHHIRPKLDANRRPVLFTLLEGSVRHPFVNLAEGTDLADVMLDELDPSIMAMKRSMGKRREAGTLHDSIFDQLQHLGDQPNDEGPLPSHYHDVLFSLVADNSSQVPKS